MRGDIAQRQVDQFGSSVVAGKVAAPLDDFAQPRVYALDGVGGVDHPPHSRWKREERNQAGPRAAPGSSHGWKFLAPWSALESGQRSLGALSTGSRVDRPDRRGQRL